MIKVIHLAGMERAWTMVTVFMDEHTCLRIDTEYWE